MDNLSDAISDASSFSEICENVGFIDAFFEGLILCFFSLENYQIDLSFVSDIHVKVN